MPCRDLNHNRVELCAATSRAAEVNPAQDWCREIRSRRPLRGGSFGARCCGCRRGVSCWDGELGGRHRGLPFKAAAGASGRSIPIRPHLTKPAWPIAGPRRPFLTLANWCKFGLSAARGTCRNPTHYLQRSAPSAGRLLHRCDFCARSARGRVQRCVAAV